MTKEKKQKQGFIYHIKTMVYKLLSKSVKNNTETDWNEIKANLIKDEKFIKQLSDLMKKESRGENNEEFEDDRIYPWWIPIHIVERKDHECSSKEIYFFKLMLYKRITAPAIELVGYEEDYKLY